MKSILNKTIFFLFFLAMVLPLSAQRSVVWDSPEYEYKFAVELFQKEKYGSAQRYFKAVFETPETQQDMRISAYYYMGLCAAHLSHPDADFLLKNYIRNYPTHTNIPEAHFYLGKFYFGNKKYKQVLEHFNQIDERHISKEDLAEYKFKKGYAYFATKNVDEAKYWFKEARYHEGEYQQKAIYYTAHIAYQNQQYEAALEDFLLLKDAPEYQSTVPFYLAQIYFMQHQYNEVIATAVPLLDKAADKTEMNRLIALSYYNLGKFAEAEPYFEVYLSDNKAVKTREDHYAAGYVFYQNKKYNAAIEQLSATTNEKDALAQNSFYIIGDCYLQQKKLTLATQSFYEAAKYDFSQDIKEDAMFNYAKLQYETSSSPFNTAIKALEQYINDYPNSSRSEEAVAYLSTIYMNTKNYQGAITSLESMSTKSPAMLKAYQRCTHFRALELINNKNYKMALKLIDKSTTYPMNQALHTANLYWKAEAEYREKQYQKSYFDFQTYHRNAHAAADRNYPMSFYSFGYSALKINKYADAEKAFQTFLTFADEVQNDELTADATARLADCNFMQKNLKAAIKNYEKCESMQQSNADYALYQQAKCYGYQRKNNEKINILKRLTQNYPKSAYNDDAEYDIALTYHLNNDYAQAIVAYQNFIDKHPKSNYTKQAYNKLAQAYLNTQEVEQSIETFKYVFENYRGTEEAKDALANLENIYTEQGTTGEFFAYIKNKGNITISAERQDSITFKAAENKYLRGDCELAIKGFADYLRQFPNGFFAADAYFYKAECAYGMNSYDQALADYESLIKRYNTNNNETALRKAAIILYNKKEFNAALGYFTQLAEVATSPENRTLAHSGIMRSAFEVEQYKTAQRSAEILIDEETRDEELLNEARYIAGKSSFKLDEIVTAKKYLAALASSSSSDLAAEAAYLNALIEFKQQRYDACEKVINDILSANYSSEYWYASTFILYGDLYAAQGNTFQARHTYQSIVDNYEGDDLKAIAQAKIDQINAAEKAAEAEQQINNKEEENVEE